MCHTRTEPSRTERIAELQVGQVCIMIHSGSRGLGHQVATDALTAMEKAMARDKIPTNDRQLACALIHSQEGKVYCCCLCPMIKNTPLSFNAFEVSPLTRRPAGAVLRCHREGHGRRQDPHQRMAACLRSHPLPGG